eukprot:COSAG01_NODE_2816_length_7019_cov_22.384682_3_plen_158_part_00
MMARTTRLPSCAAHRRSRALGRARAPASALPPPFASAAKEAPSSSAPALNDFPSPHRTTTASSKRVCRNWKAISRSVSTAAESALRLEARVIVTQPTPAPPASALTHTNGSCNSVSGAKGDLARDGDSTLRGIVAYVQGRRGGRGGRAGGRRLAAYG